MAIRVRAPELLGRAWLNTGGHSLTLASLRGKVVILDFWSGCCVNCVHVINELRPLESKYADTVVVIGVHSPKFAHERDAATVRAAVDRYRVDHPVVDDPEMQTWQQYAVRAWPTLAVIDPEGYIVAQMSGEGHGHALDVLIGELIATHAARGTLHRGDGPYVPPPLEPSTLRFPARSVLLENGHHLVADAGSHRIVELTADGQSVVRAIGLGQPGLTDGVAAKARFNEPNGLALLPHDIRVAVGYDVVVADTGNHALRSVRLTDGRVRTLAGTGEMWKQGEALPVHAFPDTALTSPWDVAWYPPWRQVAIAMAGNHQIWSFDPLSSRVSWRAGTANEGLVDGDLASAWFAQPSGLAVSADGTTLWLVDAETSSLRRIRNGVIHTEIGAGLFEFGLADGPAAEALLQHPLGVAALPDGSVVIADTYNGAIRRFDAATGQVTTIAVGLAEPSGVTVVGDHVVVVESSAHRLTSVRLPEQAVVVETARMQTKREPIDVAAGRLDLEVLFTPPGGQQLDDRYGAATHLVVSASPPELLVEGLGSGEALARTLVLSDAVADGVLHVSARAASCDQEGAEFPACHVHQQDWGVPIRIDPAGLRYLPLPLATH